MLRPSNPHKNTTPKPPVKPEPVQWSSIIDKAIIDKDFIIK